MAELWEYPHNLPEGIEFYDSEEELTSALEKVSSAIGWIVIEFNSLEDSIGFCIKEIVSTSEARDSFVYALIANMGFTAKANALVNLYGEMLERCDLHDLREPLKELDTKLKEAARRRNCYAHADWAGISRQNLVSVKITASRKGVRQLYRTFEPEEMAQDLHYIRQTTELLVQFDEALNERMNERLP
jgi:hypothetical protein